jgi:hypothetical protein
MRSNLALVTTLLLLATPTFAAEAPKPTVIRGTVEKFDGHALVVNARNGAQVSITLATNFTVTTVVKSTPADIKEGAYLAATSVIGGDGRAYALEVHIFPESMRGFNEGQKPWDLAPSSTMTNATVTGIAGTPQGELMKVSYGTDKTALVVVKPDTPVVAFAPGDATLLQHGAAIFAIALNKPDGSLVANSVTAEKAGVKPPM